MAGNQRKFQTAMLHGDRFFEQGKWSDAMKAYRFALAEYPNNAAAIIGFGKASLSSGQVEMAYKAFVQALKINPTNLEALALLADVQERAGKLDAAAETFLRMGNVHAARSDIDTAIEYWIRATKLTSGNVGAHMRLAEALGQQGKPRLAAREFLTLAVIFQRQGDAAQARKYVNLADELLPNDSGVLAAMEALEAGQPIQPGKISDKPTQPAIAAPVVEEYAEDDLFGLDDLFADAADEMPRLGSGGGLVESARTRALEQLANLIFEDSDNPSIMLIMQAVDMQSRNELMPAISQYRQAAENGIELPALYYNLGLLYREQGQLSEAAESLDRAVNNEHYGPAAHFVLGDIYYTTNDQHAAIVHFVDAVAAIDMQTVSGHRSYGLAQKYESFAETFFNQSGFGQISQFITSLNNFFTSTDWEQKVYDARMRMNSLSDDEDTMSLAEFLETPETEVMVTTLATTSDYMRQKFYMTASEECLRAIQKVPSFLPLHARLAEIMLKQDRTDDAINKYLYISKVYQMRNQVDQAIGTYQKILKLAPMDVTVRTKLINLYTTYQNYDAALDEYLVLADSYYQLAQVDRALEKYAESIQLADRTGNGIRWKQQALTRVADIYNQRFDWARATDALQQLLQLQPNNEAVLHQLVDLLYKQGKNSQAISRLDELLAIYQRQNPQKATSLLRDLVQSFPDDLLLRQRLAVSYVQNNKIREAVAEYDTLGEMQLERGLREQAVQTIQAIINLGPGDVEGYKQLLQQISGGAF